jgi:hypothetical protein
MREARTWIRAELEKCTEFWLKNGMDTVNGGVYTCLDRGGKVYSTDKSVWMQGRCAWTFSFLCARYGVKKQWLDAAKSCLDFLEKYCLNKSADDRMYFTVTADGKPLRREFGHMATQIENVVALVEGETYRAGALEFEVLHTPGHSPGGVSLKIDGYVFTGDALFAGSIGRSDFANSDPRKLIDGILEQLLSLPDDTIVHSGHGPATTIGRERKTNPFLT